MNKETVKQLINGISCQDIENNDAWIKYIKAKREFAKSVDEKNYEGNLISEANWLLRNQMTSCEPLGFEIRQGDICYIDFGQAYLNEIGFQHFGLILSIKQKKAFVVPMTSNETQFRTAYDEIDNPTGKKHLMRIGCLPGMAKPSVLFLNDCKYINTARIIDVKAHLSITSPCFKEIKKRIIKTICDSENL
ncbi:hypothetical protein [Anaerorhabdus sp.]|uniref:hypothetical protein n=1 Tax=Anaerorhabdus sp. TaxID=1872524 RepID=UPI002FCA3B79